MNIQYLSMWGKNREKTWSGTNYSLYKALNKKIQVSDIGFRLKFIEKLFIKLYSLSFNDDKVLGFFNNLNYLSTAIPSIHASRKLKHINYDSVVLQIGDIKKTNKPYYLYQDLSIDSLLYIKEMNPTAFKYSGFVNIPDKALKKRSRIQNNIYHDASGIFTMSKWLAKDLVENSMVPREKVHHVGGGFNVDLKNVKVMERKKNKILFVGRDFKRKSGDLTYQAFKILSEKYMDDAELYIAGPSENPLVENNSKVTYLGDLSKERLSYYYNICDIFCMPSYFEAYGLVFGEALVYGLPCIGRNNFAMKEFIQYRLN